MEISYQASIQLKYGTCLEFEIYDRYNINYTDIINFIIDFLK